MAQDPRKRQKKLAKKAAKRKAVVASKKHSVSPGSTMGSARQMAAAIKAPVHECLVGEELFERGLGTVILSRLMPHGGIATSLFLLDVFCLGVKNAHFIVEPHDAYDWRVEHVAAHETLIPITPEYARKLVEEAEAYARDLGFAPHPDYQLARQIFADIDAAACPTHFTFGKDGEPFYVMGPHDTPQRVQHILDTLTRRYGPQGFHYLMPVEGLFGLPAGDEDDEDDEDDGEEEGENIIEGEYKRL